MNFLKKIIKYFAPIVALTYFSITPLHSSAISNLSPQQTISNPKPLFAFVENKQMHNVKRGENLWVIAKQYLHNNATDIEIKNKVKEIQELSGLKSTKENDNIKYVNGVKSIGQDGLVDMIKPNQKLGVKRTYDLIPNKLEQEMNYVISNTKKENNYTKYLLSTLIIPPILLATKKKKDKIVDPPKNISNKIIEMYCSGKKFNSMIKYANKFNVEKADRIITSYIKQGVKSDNAYRKTFDRTIASKLSIDEKIKEMIVNKSTRKDIQSYVKNNGMNISYSTIYRIKKSLVI